MNRDEMKLEMYKLVEGNVKERIRWVKDARKAFKTVELIDKLPPCIFDYDCKFENIIEYGLVYKMPYNRNRIDEVKRQFIACGFRIGWERKENTITNTFDVPTCVFELVGNSELTVSIGFADNLPGSTCTRKEIGKTMKEVPVFEWSCEGDR